MPTSQYLFFDIETSGLDPVNGAIYEVGAIAVDTELNKVAEFDAVINAPLDLMNDYVREMHTKSGLIDKIPFGFTLKAAESELLNFVYNHMHEHTGKIVLAGHSIHFDRSFVKVHMSKFEDVLSHRLLDVGGITRFYREVCGMAFSDGDTRGHRAIADAAGALDEARRLRAEIKANSNTGGVSGVSPTGMGHSIKFV